MPSKGNLVRGLLVAVLVLTSWALVYAVISPDIDVFGGTPRSGMENPFANVFTIPRPRDGMQEVLSVVPVPYATSGAINGVALTYVNDSGDVVTRVYKCAQTSDEDTCREWLHMGGALKWGPPSP